MTNKLTKGDLKGLIKEVLEESSWTRIQDKVAGPGYNPTGKDSEAIMNDFLIMSADRSEKSPEENAERYNKFKDEVNAAGYPYTRLQGKWIETDRDTGEERTVIENSLLIEDSVRGDMPSEGREDLFELGKRLSKMFDQEAFIFGELIPSKRSGKPVRVIQAYSKDGEMENWGGPWTSIELVMKDDAFWSKVRGDSGHWQLSEEKEQGEEIHDKPGSMMEAHRAAYRAKSRGKKAVFRRGAK